jgi:SHAQKYF class myb-like DNA-binding protein
MSTSTSPQKNNQSTDCEKEGPSPLKIFTVVSESSKEQVVQDAQPQQSNQLPTSSNQDSCQNLGPESPKGLLTAKKQNSVQGQGEFNVGRWSTEEHNLFLEALRIYGKNWDKIQKHVRTRCVQNIRSHSQKFNQKLEKLVDANGDLLEGVDWEKQVLAGVDEHGSAPYYFKMLMKRTKKQALKD